MARKFNGTSDRGSRAIDLSAFSVITVSFWAWNDNNSGSSRVAFAYEAPAATSGKRGFFFQIWNGTKPEVSMFTGVNQFWDDTFPVPSAGAWHHYVWIGDRSGPTNTVYVDGVLQTLTTIAHGLGIAGTSYTNGSLELASYNSTLFFAGRLAEVAIWGGVSLTASEAKGLAAGASPVGFAHPDNLIFYAPLLGVDSPEPDYGGTQKSVTMTGTTLTPHPPVMPGLAPKRGFQPMPV